MLDDCPPKLPPEVQTKKKELELLCAMAQGLNDIAGLLGAMYRDQLALKAMAEDVLRRHRQAADEYFKTLPDPCAEEPFDRCPFLELPQRTKRRDLDRGAAVFLLPDSTILRVQGEDSIQAVLPDGTIEPLAPDEEYRLHTSDGRTFQLDPDCPYCPQPQAEEPEQPDVPEIPPDPAQCEEPRR
jgi:hypothetical protein